MHFMDCRVKPGNDSVGACLNEMAETRQAMTSRLHLGNSISIFSQSE
jgi:hypothetical protein